MDNLAEFNEETKRLSEEADRVAEDRFESMPEPGRSMFKKCRSMILEIQPTLSVRQANCLAAVATERDLLRMQLAQSKENSNG